MINELFGVNYMQIKGKKSKFFLAVAVSTFCLFFNNISLAENLQVGDLNNNLNLTESALISAENQTNETDFLAAKQDEENIPAVSQPCKYNTEFGLPSVHQKESNQDKNIVPVLDLKGGVQQQEIKKETPLEIWLHEDYATGNWGGLRSKLEEHGVTISGSYMTTVHTKSRHGGLLYKRGTSYHGLLNTAVEFDTQKMGLYPGGKLFVLFQNVHGKGLSEKYIGDTFIYNNVDAGKRTTQLSEYWYEQGFLDDKFKLKIGKQDANCEFQALDKGFEFINSGFNFIPNSAVPAYPNAAMGLTATIQPTDDIYVKYGFYDGQAVGSESGFNTIFHNGDTYKHYGEIGVTPDFKGHPGKYIIGTWYNSENVDELLSTEATDAGVEPGLYTSNHGFYTEFEQMIFKEKIDNEEDDQGLTLIGQYSWAPPHKNEMTKYFGTAISYKGLIPKRDNDTLGVGINFANFSKRLGHIKGESVLEVFYKMALTPWLYIQPDFQLINKPYNADRSVIVFGIRTNIDF